MQRKVLILLCSILQCTICFSQIRFAVIPLEFSDCKFSISRDSLEALCGKAENYFNKSFHGKNFFHFELLDTYCSNSQHSIFGENTSSTRDARFHELAFAAAKANENKVDFSKFKHLLFITAGKNEANGAESDWFWPCQENFPSNVTLILDGKTFNKYAKSCEPESGIMSYGLMCHEAGHLLGLPDLYDTDGEKSGGTGHATFGFLSLMDKGDKVEQGCNPPLLNAIELNHLDIGHPITDSLGKVNLPSIESSGTYINITGTVNGSCYLIENKGGKGLALYHSDKSDMDSGYSDYYKKNLTAAQRWSLNEVNCRPEHQCAEALLEQLLPTSDCDYFDFNGQKGIRNIKRNADESISFDIVRPIIISGTRALQESICIIWSSDIPEEEITSCNIDFNGNEYSCDNHAFEIGNLSPGNSYQYSLSIKTDKGEIYTLKSSVSTLPKYKNALPFIYFNGAQRNGDGSFKSGQKTRLTLFNKPKGIEEWYFNEARIDASNEFTLSQNGYLSVVITLEDGSRTIIRKEVTVK